MPDRRRGPNVYALLATLAIGAAVQVDSPAGAMFLALQDQQTSVPAADRPYIRYLSLYAIPVADRPAFLQALAFWLNSLSDRRPIVPVPVVADPETGEPALVRLNLFDFEWDVGSRKKRIAQLRALGVKFAKGDVSCDPWDVLAGRDPYFEANRIVTKYRTVTATRPQWNGYQWVNVTTTQKVPYAELVRGWIDPDVFDQVNKYACTRKAVLRADWFLVQTSLDRPLGAYSDFLLLPTKEADLYKTLLIDEKNQRLQALTVGGAVKAGVSFVANNPREIELLRGALGDFWRTYDFDDRNVADKEKAAVRNPRRTFRGTVRHDGREVIWELPNGLHAYGLFNGAGVQVGEVPPTIAQDRRPVAEVGRSPEAVVRNAWKCVSCHGPSSGLIPFKDVITTQILAPNSGLLAYSKDKVAAEREKRKLENYYQENYRPRMDVGRESYGQAVAKVNGLASAANSANYVKWFELYQYSTVDRAQAAREFGVPAADLDGFLRRSADPDLLFLVDDEPITRAQLELAFRAGMEGVKAYPWEVRPKVKPKAAGVGK
jgi:hypothetical protein